MLNFIIEFIYSNNDKYLKYWKIKIHELERDKLSNCDIATDPQFDKDILHKDLNIGNNLDEKKYIFG